MKQLDRRFLGQAGLALAMLGLLPGCSRNSAQARALASAWVSEPPKTFEGKALPDEDFSQVKDAMADAARTRLQTESWVLLTDKEGEDFALKPLKMRQGVSAYLVRCLTYFSPPSAIEGSTGKYYVSYSDKEGLAVGFGALGHDFDPLRETLIVLLPASPKAVYAWLSMAR